MNRRIIGYNSQRNNIKVNNLGAYSQCFSTANWMRMSFYTDKIKAGDDEGLSEFLKYIETVIGPKMEHAPHPSLFFDVQSAAVTKWLNDRDVPGHDITNISFSYDSLKARLEIGPVTIGTQKIGGLKNGHMILLSEYDTENDSFRVKDPFGNAVEDYKDDHGDNILYPVNYLMPYVVDKNGKCRVQYWSK